MLQLSQRLFGALALRKKAAIAAAAAGSPLQATAVHATAFRVADERIADLLRPSKPAFGGTHFPSLSEPSVCPSSSHTKSP